MAHYKKHGGHLPPGNQPQGGHPGSTTASQHAHVDTKCGAPFQDQDPKRRLDDFETAGEHSLQEPGGKNDANH